MKTLGMPKLTDEFIIGGFKARRFNKKNLTGIIVAEPFSKIENFNIILSNNYTVQEFVNRFTRYNEDKNTELCITIKRIGTAAIDTLITISGDKLDMIENDKKDFRTRNVLMVEGEREMCGSWCRNIKLNITTN